MPEIKPTLYKAGEMAAQIWSHWKQKGPALNTHEWYTTKTAVVSLCSAPRVAAWRMTLLSGVQKLLVKEDGKLEKWMGKYAEVVMALFADLFVCMEVV